MNAEISPKFAQATDGQDYLGKLANCVRLVDDLSAEGNFLQAGVKLALLLQHAPPELSTHLRVRAAGIGDDYKHIAKSTADIWVLEDVVRDHNPREVGAVRKGESKGKGGKAKRHGRQEQLRGWW